MRQQIVGTCALVLMLGTGCGGGGGGTGNEDPVFTSLSVSPPTLTVAAGATTAPLSVTARDQDGRSMSGLQRTFRHGVHPREHKERTAGLAVERMPFVERWLHPLAEGSARESLRD